MGKKSSKKTNQRKRLKEFTKKKSMSPTPETSVDTFTLLKDPKDDGKDTPSSLSKNLLGSEISIGDIPDEENDELDEITPLLVGDSVKSPVQSPITDATTDFSGIVANEIQELENDYLERRSVLSTKLSRVSTNYSAITNSKTLHGSSIDGALASKDSEVAEQSGLTGTRVKIILMSMYLGIFLASLDISIVSTLLTHIASEYNELERISFIVTAYLLSNATFQPLYGKISDIFGRKSVLVFCNVMFSVGCYICGASNGLWGLVLGRFISGVGGGGMTSVATIATSDLVSLRDRAFYQGCGNLFYGLGIAIGGLFGGQINDWFGWRWAFFVQVPISILSCLAIVFYMDLPATHVAYGSTLKEKLSKIDWWGSFFLIIFLALFCLGGSINIYLFSFVFMIIFIYIEFNIKSKDPILPIHFLKDKSVFGASFANWFCMMTSVTLLYYLPIYWSTILEKSATETGKRLSPNFFSTGFGSLGAGLYMKKTGKYYNFLMGFSIFGILGCLKIWLITPQISTIEQYLMFVVPGFAMSAMITITLLVIIAAVPKDHQASCTSISYAFRSTGSTIGVSIGGAIFKSSVEKLLPKKVLPLESDLHSKKELWEIINIAKKNSDYLKTAPEFVKPALKETYHFALKNTFLFCLVAFTLATLCTSVVKEFKLHTSAEREDLAEQEEEQTQV